MHNARLVQVQEQSGEKQDQASRHDTDRQEASMCHAKSSHSSICMRAETRLFVTQVNRPSVLSFHT